MLLCEICHAITESIRKKQKRAFQHLRQYLRKYRQHLRKHKTAPRNQSAI
ncbi:MAG: hypothetical protein MR782_06405 [Campylobacter sp.]|nr:hypothetical protein [Campylobacter sp.]